MEEQQLKRSIGWAQGTAMSVGAVLGSGILILPAITAQVAGPASLIAWIVMAILAFPFALTLGRLATLIPNAGGIAAYARAAYGPMAGKAVGWLFLGTIPIGAPVVALVGANYAGTLFQLSPWETTGVAALMLAVSLLLNAKGIHFSASIQVIIVIVIALLILAAIIAAFPFVRQQSFTPFVPNGWLSVGTSALLIFWCFVGWEMVTHLAEEFRNPKRDIALSLLLAAAIVGLLYVALAFVTVGTKAYGANVGVAPLSTLVGIAFGPIASNFTALLAILVSFAGLHTNIAGFTRMVYAQAREGDFPSVFARLHPTNHTPIVAIYSLAVIFTAMLALNGWLVLDLEQWMKWPSVVFLTLYMVAMLSAIPLLPKGDAGRWLAFIGLVVCVVLYPFSGWACLYSPLLVGVGWASARIRLARKELKSTY
ncbi:amino acid permease [Paenibacillus sp. 481]|uniref:amino acid permease n=1 Tax=Paenibacillus sp. 481 TaxID=2835869 RepID=UPI001E4D590C|nr:amino acid permease [Paenibacillus sp. 481]UHA73792.1 amino acid permease [Paenibacillus sp. 481]